jgi:hypothetical protein
MTPVKQLENTAIPQLLKNGCLLNILCLAYQVLMSHPFIAIGIGIAIVLQGESIPIPIAIPIWIMIRHPMGSLWLENKPHDTMLIPLAFRRQKKASTFSRRGG